MCFLLPGYGSQIPQQTLYPYQPNFVLRYAPNRNGHRYVFPVHPTPSSVVLIVPNGIAPPDGYLYYSGRGWIIETTSVPANTPIRFIPVKPISGEIEYFIKPPQSNSPQVIEFKPGAVIPGTCMDDKSREIVLYIERQ